MQCTTHSETIANGTCTYSGRPFCSDCLVEMEGKYYGKPYLDRAITEIRDRAKSSSQPNVYMNAGGGGGAAAAASSAPATVIRSTYECGKSRISAALLALLLGGLGAHKFYLGKIGLGFLYLIFCWTFIPSIIAFVEAIILLFMTDENFARKYGERVPIVVAA